MSEEKLGKRLDGHGFDGSPLSADELKEARHRHFILDNEFPTHLKEMAPSEIAKHIGLNWLAAPSLFFRDNRPLILGVIAVVGALNWQKIQQIAEFMTEFVK